MNNQPDRRFNMFGFVCLIGCSFGIAFGVIKSAHLSLTYRIVAGVAVLLVAWLIYRSGASSSYANAQAWAQSQAEAYAQAHSEAIANATAQAEAIAEASARAIAQATATNTTIIQLAKLGSPELVYDAVTALVESADEDLKALVLSQPFPAGFAPDSAPKVREGEPTGGLVS